MQSEKQLRSWVESSTGGRVADFRRHSGGRSRATFFVDLEASGDGRRELVLRVDTDDGPVAGTELTLEREAAVYRALRETPVRIPRLVASSPEGDVLLIERAPGEDTFDTLDPELRESVMASYIDAIAELHSVDSDKLELAGFGRPGRDEDCALLELALWKRIFEAKVRQPAPLVRFAFRWLERNAPRRVERVCLCHGDVGPGNFLHSGGRVEALLDWEFAHLGDPMDDLGWLAFRGHHINSGCGDLDANLRRWSERSGLPIDGKRVEYYRAFVMLRWMVACLGALEGGASSMERSVYLALVPLLGHLLSQALARLSGVEVEAQQPAPEGTAGSGENGDVIDALGSDLSPILSAALSDPEQAQRVQGVGMLLLHLKTADALGSAVRAAELEDQGALLGRRPESLEQGYAAIESRIETADPDDGAPLLVHFARVSGRRLHLWPFLAPVAHKPLAVLETS